MILTNENEHEYRFGDNGPKYLCRGPMMDFGVVVIQPNQDFDAHKHETLEESFFVLDGQCELHLDGELIVLKKGDFIQCEPGDTHYFKNTFDEPFKACFIKAPHVAKDSVYVDWKPGQPFSN